MLILLSSAFLVCCPSNAPVNFLTWNKCFASSYHLNISSSRVWSCHSFLFHFASLVSTQNDFSSSSSSNCHWSLNNGIAAFAAMTGEVGNFNKRFCSGVNRPSLVHIDPSIYRSFSLFLCQTINISDAYEDQRFSEKVKEVCISASGLRTKLNSVFSTAFVDF